MVHDRITQVFTCAAVSHVRPYPCLCSFSSSSYAILNQQTEHKAYDCANAQCTNSRLHHRFCFSPLSSFPSSSSSNTSAGGRPVSTMKRHKTLAGIAPAEWRHVMCGCIPVPRWSTRGRHRKNKRKGEHGEGCVDLYVSLLIAFSFTFLFTSSSCFKFAC